MHGGESITESDVTSSSTSCRNFESFDPQPSFPPDVCAFVEEQYAMASSLIEYGSGGSTIIAAAQKKEWVVSIESDQAWAEKMSGLLLERHSSAPVHIQYVDIGPTKAWGTPKNDRGWRRYYTYPTSPWDRSDFIHPDLVLIDGRFRLACLMTSALRIGRPTRILFDDYFDRPAYHVVERYMTPSARVGRMAVFDVEPLEFPVQDLGKILPWYHDTF